MEVPGGSSRTEPEKVLGGSLEDLQPLPGRPRLKCSRSHGTCGGEAHSIKSDPFSRGSITEILDTAQLQTDVVSKYHALHETLIHQGPTSNRRFLVR